MTIGDLILLAMFGVVGVGCYILGRLSMMHTIIKAVQEEAESELTTIAGTGEPGELSVEKINDMYYAYVGADFAGQADNFEDLIGNMKKDKRFGKFKISGIKNLSADEQKSLAQALHKNYNVK